MKNLVYFASGDPKRVFKDLPFDKVYLVDYRLKLQKNKNRDNSKVVLLPMDCFDAIDYFKKNQISIDCFVCLNEGLYEGGGRYPINSDLFVGYSMQVIRSSYIHIFDKSYYGNPFRVTMDFPR